MFKKSVCGCLVKIEWLYAEEAQAKQLRAVLVGTRLGWNSGFVIANLRQVSRVSLYYPLLFNQNTENDAGLHDFVDISR